jgi:murein DD-endopeptidase MepM/ murein hydrolase activator NlpD
LYVSAVDQAGNSTRGGFYHHIRGRKFKTDTLTISDQFLTLKLPEFQATEGFPADKSLADQFLFINTDLRKRNNQDILANGRKTQNQIFWEGAFSRLPNSAPRASFGDHRAYQYNGSDIGQAVHLGIDLASLQHAEVPAANRGRVVFVGDVGIYGNLVCLDHGFGLMSIYAHLSRIIVKSEDLVSKGDILGYTGVTGLAGGDHLHFGMFIDHVFVDPLEWWDATWITNNITSKIEMVRAMAQR